MKRKITILTLLICSTAFGQSQTKRALFLGNSYTGVNNLPQMAADAAASMGDALIFDSNAPGGYTLQGHSTNATSLSKIAIGNWDYVVLQEQSQLPALQSYNFIYAHKLDSIINANNSCAETVFYMTWGRKYGDASWCPSWPPVCTYEGMDSLLNLRYRMMADSNDAILSPVGAVWHYIRDNHPAIELYDTDESHPSVAGTYAAACSFYAALFRKDPTLITFNASLSASDAASIRSAAKRIVYDSLMVWHIGEYDPSANFTYQLTGVNEITFTNSSLNASTYLWNFGDGDTSSASNPVHTYPAAGTYTVTLIATHCGMQDTSVQTFNTTTIGINQLLGNADLAWSIFPNPATNEITIYDLRFTIYEIEIYNTLGEKVFSQLQTSNLKPQTTIYPVGYSSYGIDISQLHAGIYFVQVRDEMNNVAVRKFVKM